MPACLPHCLEKWDWGHFGDQPSSSFFPDRTFPSTYSYSERFATVPHCPLSPPRQLSRLPPPASNPHALRRRLTVDAGHPPGNVTAKQLTSHHQCSLSCPLDRSPCSVVTVFLHQTSLAPVQPLCCKKVRTACAAPSCIIDCAPKKGCCSPHERLTLPRVVQHGSTGHSSTGHSSTSPGSATFFISLVDLVRTRTASRIPTPPRPGTPIEEEQTRSY